MMGSHVGVSLVGEVNPTGCMRLVAVAQRESTAAECSLSLSLLRVVLSGKPIPPLCSRGYISFHRIIKIGKTTNITKSIPTMLTDHVPQCDIQIFLEHLQRQ